MSVSFLPVTVRSRRALEHCSAKLQSFYDYWDSKRAGRSMPSRANIDPAEMRPYLSLVMLIDVVRDPRRFVYRLVGTMETEMRGRDPTGLSVSEASSGNPQDAVAFYEMITNNRLPALYVGEYTPRPDRLIREQIIGLPLSDDGKSVNMILVFSVVEWLKEANADK